MSDLITHTNSDGTSVVFKGSSLKKALTYGGDIPNIAKMTLSAYDSQPTSQFWHDAANYVNDNNLLNKK